MDKDIQRRLSCKADIFRLRGLKNLEVWESLCQLGYTEEQVLGIQITHNACIVTFHREEFKERLLTHGLSIRNTHCVFFGFGEEVTNVTIKDLPVELPDQFVLQCILQYGKPVSGLTHGLIPGTRIKTGTRYCKLTGVKCSIPVNTTFGKHQVRLFCDNGKTECLYCGLTSHPFYQCTQRRPKVKACFLCGQTTHLKVDCLLNKGTEAVNPTTFSDPREDTFRPPEQSTPVQHANDKNAETGVPVKQTQVSKLILGASNCRAMVVDDPSVKIIAESGMCASDIDKFLEKEKNLDEVSIVVMHLGTNDLKKKNSDSDQTVLNILAAINTIRSRVPKIVQIGLCSIPPRRGNGVSCEKYNRSVDCVNKFLRQFCDRQADVLFIDNTKVLVGANGRPSRAMYNTDDSSGLHYSKEGRAGVVKNIEDALNPPSGFVELVAMTKKRNLSDLSNDSTAGEQEAKRHDARPSASSSKLASLLEEDLAAVPNSV